MTNKHSLFSISLLLSLQLPALYGSIVFLATLIFFSTIRSPGKKSDTIKFTTSRLIIATLFFLLHYLWNISAQYYRPELIAVLHGSIYLVVLLSLRGHIRISPPEKTIALLTIISLFFLFASPVLAIQDIAFVEKVNGLRFRSYFSEPAAAAIVFCLHISLIQGSRSKLLKNFVIFGNSLLVLFTFSGTGLILLSVVLFQWQIVRWSIPIVMGVVVAALIFGLVLPYQFESIVLSRAEQILTGDISNSTFLRFVAPFMVLGDAFRSLDVILTGVGIGSLSEYLIFNHSLFGYLRDFSGNRVDVLNNGYAIILILLGAPTGVTLLLYMARTVLRSNADTKAKIFFICLPMFTGVVWSASFWFSFLVAAGVLSFSQGKPEPRPSGANQCRRAQSRGAVT